MVIWTVESEWAMSCQARLRRQRLRWVFLDLLSLSTDFVDSGIADCFAFGCGGWMLGRDGCREDMWSEKKVDVRMCEISDWLGKVWNASHAFALSNCQPLPVSTSTLTLDSSKRPCQSMRAASCRWRVLRCHTLSSTLAYRPSFSSDFAPSV